MHQKTRHAPFAHGPVAKVSDKTGTFSGVAVDGADVAPVNVGAAAPPPDRRRAVALGALVTLRSKLASSSALSNIRQRLCQKLRQRQIGSQDCIFRVKKPVAERAKSTIFHAVFRHSGRAIAVSRGPEATRRQKGAPAARRHGHTLN